MKNLALKSIYFFLLFFFLFSFNAYAACGGSSPNLVAASCSQADVQDCVTAAINGNTITVPAGNETWTSAVSWSNKNIAVIGAGIGNTNITRNGKAFSVVVTTDASFRVSGMTLSGDTSNSVIQILGSTASAYTKGWRIDHIRFNYTGNAGTVNAFIITGVTWGVIDNCTFDGDGYGIVTQSAYLESDDSSSPRTLGHYAHSLPLTFGDDTAIYFEDNTVNFDGSNSSSFVFNQTYGGRIVIRHNAITGTYLQNHSARGANRGGIKFEIYNNTLVGDGFIWPVMLRSGTGVIFNNTVSGYGNDNFIIDNQRTCITFTGLLTRCDGNNAYDGNTVGEYGWPCVDQIGRGQGNLGNQPSVPLYAWNNGTSVIVVNGDFDECSSDPPPILTTHLKTTGDGSPHAGGVLDYINNGSTAKPGYTSYTYPHPLQGVGGGCGDGICTYGECIAGCTDDCSVEDCCGTAGCNVAIGETVGNCPGDCSEDPPPVESGAPGLSSVGYSGVSVN